MFRNLSLDSIDAGKIACIVAAIAILAYMLLSYGLFGLFANIALIINVGLIFGLLSIVGATLTITTKIRGKIHKPCREFFPVRQPRG